MVIDQKRDSFLIYNIILPTHYMPKELSYFWPWWVVVSLLLFSLNLSTMQCNYQLFIYSIIQCGV